MRLKKMVMIYNDEVRARTSFISQGLGREHKSIIQTINKNKKDFEEFGKLENVKSNDALVFLKKTNAKPKKGRPFEEYLLNEQQIALLITYLRNIGNSDIVKNFKKALVREFYRMRTALLNAKAQHSDINWQGDRKKIKVGRSFAADTMKEFIEYAKKQGSQHADKYYMIISRMTNETLFIIEDKFKSLRDLMTPQQLFTIGGAELIIDKALKDGMKAGIYYKDIFQQVKKNVELFAELHGKSEIIKDILPNERILNTQSDKQLS